ncbi:MAG TPA: 30S ribosomal protein S1 [Candidatus Saccharimonadales bacterium]|nr:30S ribosomal protein S1 [Candidatus Saccharimonadales bacterium]
MTEDQQSGTAPEPEATASEPNQALEETGAAVAVAEEPAETSPATEAPMAETAPEPASADAVTAPVTAEAPANGVDAGPAEAATADDPVTSSADAPTTNDAAAASSTDEASPLASGDDRPVEVAEAPAAETTAEAPAAEAPAAEAPAAEAASESTATDVGAEAPAAATDADTTPADGLDASDTADAPAADDEPEPVAPPRELGPEPTTMEELLAEQDSDIKSFKHGDVVEGNVVRIDKDEILVDIGAKSEGVVSNRELFGRHGEGQAPLNIGDTVLVYVLQPESPEGHAVLSLRRAGLERKWRAMQEQFEAGVIIEAPVIDHNKGGLIVDCGIRGFVPISQIVDFPRRPQNDQPRDAAQEIAEKLQPFVGRKLRLKILEVNRKANRLILSEKVALYEERREKRDELFSSLQVGQKVTGTVRSIAPFGVFIDLGGIDGLVHKSELSWNKVNNPESGYKVGDEVEAEVIDINHERGRISLSIRRLQPDPWHSTVADFNVGDVIDGTVTKLVNFGAFVRVRDGLEGLIHISELSHQRVAHPGDVVHEGQSLKLKIISLDSERHRLGLSLKQAEEPPARPAPEPGQPAPSSSGPRPERRPRQDRAYSPSDAVQEPEGGIDNTLASAFAQVRQQLAAAEGEGTDAVEAPAPETEPEPPAAEATSVDAPAADASEALHADAAEAPIADEPAAAFDTDTGAPAIDLEAEAPAVDSEALAADTETVVEAPAAEAEAVDEDAAAEAIVETPTVDPTDEGAAPAVDSEAQAADTETILEAPAAETEAAVEDAPADEAPAPDAEPTQAETTEATVADEVAVAEDVIGNEASAEAAADAAVVDDPATDGTDKPADPA